MSGNSRMASGGRRSVPHARAPTCIEPRRIEVGLVNEGRPEPAAAKVAVAAHAMAVAEWPKNRLLPAAELSGRNLSRKGEGNETRIRIG